MYHVVVAQVYQLVGNTASKELKLKRVRLRIEKTSLVATLQPDHLETRSLPSIPAFLPHATLFCELQEGVRTSSDAA